MVNCEDFFKGALCYHKHDLLNVCRLEDGVVSRTFWKRWSDKRIEKLALFGASQRGILFIYFNIS